MPWSVTPFNTKDTVVRDTPARRATSALVGEARLFILDLSWLTRSSKALRTA